MILSEEEKAWYDEHGCIHGLYPDEDPIFCPNCKPDITDVKALLRKRMEALRPTIDYLAAVEERREQVWIDVDLEEKD